MANYEEPSGGCPMGHVSLTDHGIYYGEYLQLDKILGAQEPESVKAGQPAHDETLFIITHQVYELWFKQILHELDSVIEIFSSTYVEEMQLGIVAQRLNRVTEIQKILIDQVQVLETMSPMDFLEFRQLLTPASGFQSVQFRLLENLLGLKKDQRVNYQNTEYVNYFKPQDKSKLTSSHTRATLLKSIEAWLERTPFVEFEGFDFWGTYRKAVEDMLDKDEETTRTNQLLTEEGKQSALSQQQKTREAFETLFDEKRFAESVERGDRRLSHSATRAALLIYLYREMPMLQLPFQILNLLTDIDERLSTWRYRHTMMVQRMIGVKLGTGGSSGFYYLRSTMANRYKVFLDLFNLSTYLIPLSVRPRLPDSLVQKLSFQYESTLEKRTHAKTETEAS